MSIPKEGSGKDHGILVAHATKRWRCDACGQWNDGSQLMTYWDVVDGVNVGHRLLHASGGCVPAAFDERNAVALALLIGADGLAILLGWIESGVHEVSGVVEMIRRIHVPRYESVFPWCSENLPLHDPRYPLYHMCLQEMLETVRQDLQKEGWPQPKSAGRFLRPGASYAAARIAVSADPDPFKER